MRRVVSRATVMPCAPPRPSPNPELRCGCGRHPEVAGQTGNGPKCPSVRTVLFPSVVFSLHCSMSGESRQERRDRNAQTTSRFFLTLALASSERCLRRAVDRRHVIVWRVLSHHHPGKKQNKLLPQKTVRLCKDNKDNCSTKKKQLGKCKVAALPRRYFRGSREKGRGLGSAGPSAARSCKTSTHFCRKFRPLPPPSGEHLFHLSHSHHSVHITPLVE